tara:strand:- start:1988 stop:2692 length:705 start_codon:yes stop_codon:yes gene_type:complete
MNGGIPIFPLGVIKIYNNPNPPVYKSDFKFVGQGGNNPNTTQFGDELPNIVEKPEMKDLKVWFEECTKDYLDNVMQIAYDEYWIHESWINEAKPGSHQNTHNHGNSIISGVYYFESVPEHPPLVFEKVAFNTDPFMSLRKHYNRGNPNFQNQLAFPCTKGSLIMFNSYLYHGFAKNNTEHTRVSLAFNILANLSDRDHYKLNFKKEERFFNREQAEYSVQSNNAEGEITRSMSK